LCHRRSATWEHCGMAERIESNKVGKAPAGAGLARAARR
jgi:hypothetical protein